MVRRGQSGVEFLAVTGIGMVLLLAVSFFLLSDTKTSRDEAQLQQVQQIADSVLQQSRVVQSQGRNSWVTVEANLPPVVRSIYTTENNTLVFDIDTVHGVVSQPVFSQVPIKGYRDSGQRSYLDNGSNFHAGVVRFTVYNNGSYVLLSYSG